MSNYVITGGIPLCGTVRAGGAKNSALPVLCAALLCDNGEVTVHNCPDITDVTYTMEILKSFGCKVMRDGNSVTVNTRSAHPCAIPSELTEKLRSASLFLGAGLSKFHTANQGMPGGCNLGARPIDIHLSAFEKMGVETDVTEDGITCKNRPHGSDIFLRYPSVGATENIIIAAAKADGTTTVTGAAREPEITDLCNFINAMGGRISGAGGDVIVIEGVEKLNGISYNIINDRIETATYLLSALATDGRVTVVGSPNSYLQSVIELITECGGTVSMTNDSITVCRRSGILYAPQKIETGPYPAFPTDVQSVALCSLLKICGTAKLCDTVFPDRFQVANELRKMNADITVTGNTATVTGVKALHGAKMRACDLRSGAGLVIAALCAKDESIITEAEHIERGYQDFTEKLSLLGAKITKTEDVQNGHTKRNSEAVLFK